MQRPEEALAAFTHAIDLSPYPRNAPWGSSFYSRVAAGRARIWLSRGEIDRAIDFQKQAVAFTPNDPARLTQLADLYDMRDNAGPAKTGNTGGAQPHSQ
jgi:tetratricopeptide (TPR) repeat protein